MPKVPSNGKWRWGDVELACDNWPGIILVATFGTRPVGPTMYFWQVLLLEMFIGACRGNTKGTQWDWGNMSLLTFQRSCDPFWMPCVPSVDLTVLELVLEFPRAIFHLFYDPCAFGGRNSGGTIGKNVRVPRLQKHSSVPSRWETPAGQQVGRL